MSAMICLVSFVYPFSIQGRKDLKYKELRFRLLFCMGMKLSL